MEQDFQKTRIPCLDMQLRQVRNSEQTQELRLSDGMPDVGRVLCAWGQPILRGKEWRGGEISVSGGTMVWVLYAPEDGSSLRTMESWIPFRMEYDVEDQGRDGQIRCFCTVRSVDARALSTRKILIRCSVCCYAQALRPIEAEMFSYQGEEEKLQVLRRRYPVRLWQEAGEKVFALDEELTVPPSAPQPEKLVYYTLNPEISDAKILSGRVVFRGNANLHVLYLGEEGKMNSWEFPVSFSQFGDLEGEYSPDAAVEILPSVTNLEMQVGDEGRLHVKCGLVGQYLVEDSRILEVASDAYSLDRDIEPVSGELMLPVVLDKRGVNLTVRQSLPGVSGTGVDVQFTMDIPRQKPRDGGVFLETAGTFQTLYYDGEGVLNASTAYWEGEVPLDVHENAWVDGRMQCCTQPQMLPDGEGQSLGTEVSLSMTCGGSSSIPMIMELKLGELLPKEPDTPTLILKRAGDQTLWELAKKLGTTVSRIQSANHLEGEPEPARMLLIPIPK